ncbi:hypothetical protein [Actinomadura latina]|uniref:Uncharacterized protein n=1 Tax=Actinomadura latina TaxID=163603 RepID=A0A846ZF99_9ACTN|nr:hypothetical protein [Actinomadura latina]NKZ08766.1 hypothetical protein [Actinomadura latina]
MLACLDISGVTPSLTTHSGSRTVLEITGTGYARALAAAGDLGEAQRVLDTLDRGAASLPGEIRAGLDSQAVHVRAR